jgi:hypothetical protein
MLGLYEPKQSKGIQKNISISFKKILPRNHDEEGRLIFTEKTLWCIYLEANKHNKKI